MTAALSADIALLAPELAVFGTALLILVVDLWLPPDRRGWLVAAGLAGLAWAGWIVAGAPEGIGFANMFVRDAVTRTGEALALAVAGLGMLVAPEYLRRTRLEQGEYYVLVVTAAGGAMLMGASRDLLMLFLSLETLSIPLYVLAVTSRASVRSQEAGMKYFLLGAFASAFFLYGVALLYGAAGTTRLADLGQALGRAPASTAAAAGVGLLTIGLGFKAALVPFHTWAPDVYEGAPLPAATFMSVIAKIGAFLALLRVFPLSLAALIGQWTAVLGALAAVTMIVANLAALAQTSYKRLLAYSSIAHAGYLLVGVAVGTPAAVSAVLTYLVVYAAMTTGAFAVAIALERGGQEADRIDDYAGLYQRAPWLAVATGLFMVSLAGLPPLAGFFAKLGVFEAAIEGGGALGILLTLIGVLSSVVSVYYYLRVAYVMFTGESAADVRINRSPLVDAALILTAAAVVQIGIAPATVTALAQRVGALLR